MGRQRVGADGKTASCRDQQNPRSRHDRHHAGGDADAAAFVAGIVVVGITGRAIGVTGAVEVAPMDAAALIDLVHMGGAMVVIRFLCGMHMSGRR